MQLGFARLAALPVAQAAVQDHTALKPLLRTVDLDRGEPQLVELADGTRARIQLLAVEEERDSVRSAVRQACVKVEINGQRTTLDCANDRLPITVGGVPIDCPVTRGYYENCNPFEDSWGLDKDARLRLWPEGSPWAAPGTFIYPIKQRGFAGAMQMANEPSFVDGGDDVPTARPIYYHLVDLPEGGDATVDLSAAKGRLSVEWTHPITGKTTPGEAVDGGGKRPLKVPFAGDAVLFVRAMPRASGRDLRKGDSSADEVERQPAFHRTSPAYPAASRGSVRNSESESEGRMTLDTRANLTAALLGGLLASGFVASSRGAEPLKLHPENPHYVIFRGKPTVLVASTEHYGAVLNRAFDFRPYLEELKAAGLNYTRIFSGVYSEPWGEPFNSLNPPRGRLFAPWARSATPGYADGGNQFDLDKWDDAYFKRLREFIDEAGKRGVVVELTLFCNWYDDKQWRLSPLYVRNNVNGVGDRDSRQVNSLRSGDVLQRQEAMVRKIVAEVNDLDNVFFEICNEPGAEDDWMDHMAEVIWEAEGQLPNRHLIANNGHPVPHMAIFNAHYDRDGSFVRGHYGRNLVIGYDETGFDGASDRPYRRQGWHFLLSGGGLYDNLDWSFSVARPDGTETKWDKNLGGGSPALRRQLGILRAFLEGFDLPKLKPDKGVVKGGAPGNFSVLAQPGKQYAIYLDGGNRAELQVELPAGDYAAEWIDTRSGAKARAEDVSGGGVRTLKAPGYAEDIALRILRKGPGPRGRE